MQITTIVGARPQFVKAAVVSRAIGQLPNTQETLVHTGQHYDENMSDVFFNELNIPRPTHYLGVGSGPHGRQTGRMLEAIEEVLQAQRPDWVLVYGDTNSTLAGALAAAKLHIPVAHVEAGLRSFNRNMPEEINRIVTDHTSSLLFAPSTHAVQNLEREGVDASKTLLVGDVMYDAALYYAERALRRSSILDSLKLRPKEYALATVHRAENTDDSRKLRSIFSGLCELAQEIVVVVPIHPRTRAVLVQAGEWNRVAGALRIIEPVGYLDMVMLEMSSRVVITDSGGVQKEAFFHKVPCVTLRDETEWVELVESGHNRLVSPLSNMAIVEAVRQFLISGPPATYPALFGHGDASVRIAQELLDRRVQVE